MTPRKLECYYCIESHLWENENAINFGSVEILSQGDIHTLKANIKPLVHNTAFPSEMEYICPICWDKNVPTQVIMKDDKAASRGSVL